VLTPFFYVNVKTPALSLPKQRDKDRGTLNSVTPKIKIPTLSHRTREGWGVRYMGLQKTKAASFWLTAEC